MILGAGLGVVLLVGLLAFGAWYKLFREVDQDFADVSEQFAYGSIGSEGTEGIPFEIWRVLPEIFPDHLPGPGGYRSLGMYQEKGRDTPVGFTKKTVGFPRVAFNCAACHSATFRAGREAKRRLVLTAPATTFDPQGYVRFLIAAGADKRFTADNILEAIERHTDLSWIDRQLYRYVIIPRLRDALREQKRRFAWTERAARLGQGPHRPVQPGEVPPAQVRLGEGQDDRQLRHGAVVEHGAQGGLRAALGRPRRRPHRGRADRRHRRWRQLGHR